MNNMNRNGNNTDTLTNKSRSGEGFRILRVKIEPYQIVFRLDGEKSGCREIVVEGEETPVIKDILLRFFESPQGGFDFTISKVLGNGQCKISEIIRTV